METLEQRIFCVVEEFMGLHPGDVTLDSDLRDDLCLDSLESVELIMELESKFHVDIPDSVTYNITTSDDASYRVKTVQDLINAVVKLIPQT